MLHERMLASEDHGLKGITPYPSKRITGSACKRAEFMITALRNRQRFVDNYIKL